MVKKAHLVTGKGGVGKSLFSAAFAYALSLENKPILLTELNEMSFYRDYLEMPDLGYKPIPFKQNIDVAQWSPDDCLKEYALHLLKIESLYKLFFENPVTKSLIQIAPGLHELALLGKLTSSPRRHGPPMPYNQIVADSFATGHFLALMRSAGALNEAIRFGPMGEQTKSIDSFIRNAEFTHVHIVTLAEELPITETIELAQQIKNEFGLHPKIYLNKIIDFTKDERTQAPKVLQAPLEDIALNQTEARTKLSDAGLKFQELPFVFKTKAIDLITTLQPYLKDLA
jgi:anion-transporting  ArsA/GET3 family ATPase